MNQIQHYIENIRRISPHLKYILTQIQYDIFQNLVNELAHETSWSEKYTLIYDRIHDILTHKGLDNTDYDDLKKDIYSIVQPLTVSDLEQATTSKIASHINIIYDYPTYYINTLAHIRDYKASKHNHNNSPEEIYHLFDVLINLLHIYGTYHDEYYGRLMDETTKIKLRNKSDRLINRISKYTAMHRGFKRLFATPGGEKVIHILCDHKFLSDKDKTNTDYIYLLWCHGVCWDMINKLYNSIQYIDDIIEDDNIIIKDTITYCICYKKDIYDDIEDKQQDINEIIENNDMKKDMMYFTNAIYELIQDYRQCDIQTLAHIDETIKNLISSHNE